MSDSQTENWRLIIAATRDLTAHGRSPFSRIDVYRRLWRQHPERQRASLDPTFQGLVRNAPGGPASACGTPLRRVAPGQYELS